MEPMSGILPPTPESLSPGIIGLFLQEDWVGVDMERFPISEEDMGDMPKYLTRVNNIITDGGSVGITENFLVTCIAQLRKVQDTIESHGGFTSRKRRDIVSESLLKYSKPFSIWLQTYLEIIHPAITPDNFVGPPTKEEVNQILQEDDPEFQEARLARFRKYYREKTGKEV